VWISKKQKDGDDFVAIAFGNCYEEGASILHVRSTMALSKANNLYYHMGGDWGWGST
jgi:hypothetical protein